MIGADEQRAFDEGTVSHIPTAADRLINTAAACWQVSYFSVSD